MSRTLTKTAVYNVNDSICKTMAICSFYGYHKEAIDLSTRERFLNFTNPEFNPNVDELEAFAALYNPYEVINGLHEYLASSVNRGNDWAIKVLAILESEEFAARDLNLFLSGIGSYVKTKKQMDEARSLDWSEGFYGFVKSRCRNCFGTVIDVKTTTQSDYFGWGSEITVRTEEGYRVILQNSKETPEKGDKILFDGTVKSHYASCPGNRYVDTTYMNRVKWSLFE